MRLPVSLRLVQTHGRMMSSASSKTSLENWALIQELASMDKARRSEQKLAKKKDEVSR